MESYFFQVKVIVEARDKEHVQELEALLRNHYDHVSFGSNVF